MGKSKIDSPKSVPITNHEKNKIRFSLHYHIKGSLYYQYEHTLKKQEREQSDELYKIGKKLNNKFLNGMILVLSNLVSFSLLY